MTILSGQAIRRRGVFTPFSERALHEPTSLSYGLGPAGYDVRCREGLIMPPGAFALASTVEHFDVPTDVVATVHDKSTLARMGLAVQNTVVEPGWRGYLTLELSNNHPPLQPPHEILHGLVHGRSYPAMADLYRAWRTRKDEYDAEHTVTLQPGQPIAQIILRLTDEPVESPYVGRYQDQAARPVGATRVDASRSAALGYGVCGGEK